MNKTYHVSTANWILQIVADPSSFDNMEHFIAEIGTRAVEVMFGHKELGDGEDIVAIFNKNKQNIFELEESQVTRDDYIPNFGVIMKICECGDPDGVEYELTSVLFANAAQTENYKLAKVAETDPAVQAAMEAFHAYKKAKDTLPQPKSKTKTKK